jgi:hypothetical protein
MARFMMDDRVGVPVVLSETGAAVFPLFSGEPALRMQGGYTREEGDGINHKRTSAMPCR